MNDDEKSITEHLDFKEKTAISKMKEDDQSKSANIVE